jgi:hypothetical protein
MKLAVLYPVGRTVVTRGNKDRDPQSGGILEHLVHLLARLRAPVVLGTAPADRNHRIWIGRIMDRRRNCIYKATIGIGREIYRDP